MIRTYRRDDWDHYRMKYAEPHRVLELMEKETAVVEEALRVLRHGN